LFNKSSRERTGFEREIIDKNMTSGSNFLLIVVLDVKPAMFCEQSLDDLTQQNTNLAFERVGFEPQIIVMVSLKKQSLAFTNFIVTEAFKSPKVDHSTYSVYCDVDFKTL